jgi:tRNA(fMet)-specific endonuclease VapC
MYLFDTDMVSFFIRNKPSNIRVKTAQHNDDDLCISAITYAELIFGLRKNYSKQLDYWLGEVMGKFRVFAFDSAAASIYGDIRAKLEKSGTPLDNMDIMIAATSLSNGAILVSHNTKHFAKIKGLKVEDWCG